MTALGASYLYLVLCTLCFVLCTLYIASEIEGFSRPGVECKVQSTKYKVLSTKYQVPSTKYETKARLLLPSSCPHLRSYN
jgi:hypothetical protein